MAYGAKKVQIKFNSNRLTHFGGVYLFHLFLKQIGWRHLIGRTLKFEQRNSLYTISEQIFSLLYPIILGLSRIEISKKKLLVDMDSTVCTIYGHQEGALKGYNPRARGRRSYHPLFCFESMSGTSLLGTLRQGNAYTSLGAFEYLVQFFHNYPSSEYSVRFRGDSGFYDKDIVALLSQNKADFAIVADMTGPLKQLVTGLAYCPASGTDNRYSFAETTYQPAKWGKPYRYCIIRKKLEPEESDQATLFTVNAYSYSAIVT
ncbi:MAG: transposase, partial [Chlamydiae bacterium]|nr:transposase [Chlamydiota bacterium]